MARKLWILTTLGNFRMCLCVTFWGLLWNYVHITAINHDIKPLAVIKLYDFKLYCGSSSYRYGDADPDLEHDYDMKIKLQMSAVQYIHTKRFQSELMAFVTHFSQIQESLRRMRTIAAGNQV